MIAPQTIDLTPTWSGIVMIMVRVWAENHDKGLEEELQRMAHLADLYVAEHKDDSPEGEQS